MSERNHSLPDAGMAMGSASGGSLAGASHADMKRGYSLPFAGEHTEDCCCDECMPMHTAEQPPGFLTRPEGWER